eukprot:COSAG06_NODE_26316_length_617_cov_1.040541_1_plen_154_part_01
MKGRGSGWWWLQRHGAAAAAAAAAADSTAATDAAEDESNLHAHATSGWEIPAGCGKNAYLSFASPSYISWKTDHFYQDRLRTNIARESTQNRVAFFACRYPWLDIEIGGGMAASYSHREHMESVALSHLYIETNILPRQARDKHRESTQKRDRC